MNVAIEFFAGDHLVHETSTLPYHPRVGEIVSFDFTRIPNYNSDFGEWGEGYGIVDEVQWELSFEKPFVTITLKPLPENIHR